MHQKEKAFTLTDVMIVVVIIGLIMSFGISNYYKSQERAFLKNAISQLEILKRAQELYFTKYDTYYSPSASCATVDLDKINEGLNIYLIENGFSYACDCGVVNSFECRATREDNSFIVTVRNDIDPTCSLDCP